MAFLVVCQTDPCWTAPSKCSTQAPTCKHIRCSTALYCSVDLDVHASTGLELNSKFDKKRQHPHRVQADEAESEVELALVVLGNELD